MSPKFDQLAIDLYPLEVPSLPALDETRYIEMTPEEAADVDRLADDQAVPYGKAIWQVTGIAVGRMAELRSPAPLASEQATSPTVPSKHKSERQHRPLSARQRMLADVSNSVPEREKVRKQPPYVN